MSKPTHSESMEPSGPNGDQKPTPSNSIEQRRNALRRVGQAAAAAGVTSPMAALATGTGTRKWACDPPKTNKVHATISGCKSVLVSAQAGNQCYGKSCSWYKYSSNIPAGCKDSYGNPKKFRDILSCASGSKDSNNVTYYPGWDNGCLFHKQIHTLCANYASSAEAHWAVAFCNSTSLWSSSDSVSKFPYSPTEVSGHWQDPAIKADAYCFYTDYMEAG